MNKLFSISIRTQLFFIVSILAFFAAGIIVYSGISFRKGKIREAKNDAAMLADSVANEHEKMVADCQQLMITLAQLLEIRHYRTVGLQELMKRVLKANPKYSNIFIADPEGKVLASAVPVKDINVSDRSYFINALATGHISSGAYTISRFTGKAVLPFAYPFKDSGGKIVGVIVMGIDLTYYRTLLDTLQLPSGSSYLLLDHKGIIMTRGINPADFVGQQYNPAAFEKMVKGPERDTFIAVAHDGIRRFISYRKIRLDGERTPYMYIRSGIPVSAALSGANKSLIRNLVLLASSLCLVVFLVLLIAKHAIIGRIALLERASRRMADGELNVKVSDLIAGGELGRLGLTFDKMAGQIALREEALRESEERYRTLFEQSPDGILIIDDAGKIIEFNDTASRQLGYSRDEFAKLNVSDLETGESSQEIRGRIGRILQDGEAEFEVKHITKNGEIRDVNIITRVILLSGRPLMYAIWHDITARKRAQRELKSSEERLNTILDNVGAAIFIKDTAYRYTYVNGNVCKAFGRTAEEILGKGDEEFFSAGSVEEIMRSDRPVIARGETVNREETELTFSGKLPRTYWTVKLPLRDSNGAITGLCGISTDITELKQAEEAKDRLLNAISVATEGIAITDDKDRFIYVNDAHARIYGYRQNELIGKTWRDTVKPDLQPLIETELARTLHDKTVGIWAGECPALRKDSIMIATEITATSRWDETSNYIGHICIVRDITERKLAENRLMLALREKEILLQEVHHRVKNNLQVVASLLRLQSKYLEDEKSKAMFEDSQRRIESMSLIHEKLYCSKDLAGIDFKDYIASLIENVTTLNSRSGKVRIVLDIGDVMLDINRSIPCGLIINELVSNTLKHAFPGGQGGEVVVKMWIEDSGKISLVVRDNGAGFPDNIDFRNTQSLGMQLVISLVSQLDGTIELEKREGAKFTITFKA